MIWTSSKPIILSLSTEAAEALFGPSRRGEGTRAAIVRGLRERGYTGTIADMEHAWLSDQGHTEGTRADRWTDFLKKRGHKENLPALLHAERGRKKK